MKRTLIHLLLGASILTAVTASAVINREPEPKNPYAWTMSCDRWVQRAQEILEDEKLGTHQQRIQLISHLRTKVQEDCKVPADLIL